MSIRPTSTITNNIVYSDISNSFIVNPINNSIPRVTNENSVKQSIKNIVLTNSGERPYKQNLGANIRRLLFEMLDLQTIAILKSQIINTIEQYEPRVSIISVDILSASEDISRDVVLAYSNLNSMIDYKNENSLVINIRYSIININNEQSLNITVERTR